MLFQQPGKLLSFSSHCGQTGCLTSGPNHFSNGVTNYQQDWIQLRVSILLMLMTHWSPAKSFWRFPWGRGNLSHKDLFFFRLRICSFINWMNWTVWFKACSMLTPLASTATRNVTILKIPQILNCVKKSRTALIIHTLCCWWIWAQVSAS